MGMGYYGVWGCMGGHGLSCYEMILEALRLYLTEFRVWLRIVDVYSRTGSGCQAQVESLMFIVHHS
jgi:hypothetical protein